MHKISLMLKLNQDVAGRRRHLHGLCKCKPEAIITDYIL
jgi:hypothetical protein